MADEAWSPLSARGDPKAIEAYGALVPGVPPWMQSSLWEWVRGNIAELRSGYWWASVDKLRALERALRFDIGWSSRDAREPVAILEAALRNETLMLDAVDYLASKHSGNTLIGALAGLERVLTEAGSGWTVARLGGRWGLRRRVDETVASAAQAVMESGDAPGQLLARAWAATYGREPDASDAYRQAVRAVEAAAIPVVSPKDRDATLGRVIGTLRANADQWRVSLSHRNDADLPVQTLVSMMDLLWGSQHDRHVSPEDEAPLHVSQPEAEAAIHLSVTLVQWFSSGAVSRR